MVTVMAKPPNNPPEASSAEAMAAAVARARWLMLISALTTAIAIAAVAGVIGYRVFGGGGSGAGTITNGMIMLPKGAHVVSTTVSAGSIVVTVDIAGVTEVRIFDRKTLQQTGRLSFGTELQ
jgi:hypothetical protein